MYVATTHLEQRRSIVTKCEKICDGIFLRLLNCLCVQLHSSHVLFLHRQQVGAPTVPSAVLSANFMSFHALLCHFISCHFMSCHFMSFHVISCHFMSLHVISRHFTSFHVISSHIMSFQVSLYFSPMPFKKVGRGHGGQGGSNMSSKALGNSFAVRPKANTQLSS
jgi:hypothetical protein